MRNNLLTFEEYKTKANYDPKLMKGRLEASKNLLSRKIEDDDLRQIYQKDIDDLNYILNAIDFFERNK